MITIKRATLIDVPRIVPLYGLYREFYRTRQDADGETQFLEARISKNESVIFLAENESGEAIGFMQLYPSFSSVSMAPIWVLNDLYVDESVRGSGAGRALLERAEVFARETGAIRLELATEVTNERTQAVYNACGWIRNTTFYHYSKTI